MEQSVAGKKLLIMGGRPAATPDIVRAAKRMGVYTIVTDNVPPERSPAKLMADEYWDISTAEVERLAEAEQSGALESDAREGVVEEYLERLLPEDWDRMDLSERRGFLRGDPFTGGSRVGTARRTVVSAVEIWAECFGKEPTAIRRSDTYDIFGMLMKIGGWEKYSGNRSASMKRAFYGIQRCFVRR